MSNGPQGAQMIISATELSKARTLLDEPRLAARVASFSVFWVTCAIRRPAFVLIWTIGLGATAFAQADRATTILVSIVETHDRLTPTPKPGIIKQREFTVLLKPNKQIEESWVQTDVTGEVHSDPGGAHSTSMGENDGKAVWHVLANNQLQRVAQTREQLMIWNLSIGANKECRVSVKYLLKQGAGFTTGKIAGTDIEATFSHSQVVSASCSIQ
jgi:hypothetical protein